MQDDVLLNKADTLEKYVLRITEIYGNDPKNIYQNQTSQDAIVLNLERACQAAIDMAMRAVKIRKLGLPKESRDAFDLLLGSELISRDLCRRMHGLIGFRNTAVHNYKKLDLKVVESIILNHLKDFKELSSSMLVL
jgi:uncharacterized protein YutE (UPF0331/DUF86 family)